MKNKIFLLALSLGIFVGNFCLFNFVKAGNEFILWPTSLSVSSNNFAVGLGSDYKFTVKIQNWGEIPVAVLASDKFLLHVQIGPVNDGGAMTAIEADFNTGFSGPFSPNETFEKNVSGYWVPRATGKYRIETWVINKQPGNEQYRKIWQNIEVKASPNPPASTPAQSSTPTIIPPSTTNYCGSAGTKYPNSPKIYPADATSFGSDKLCQYGDPTPNYVQFPSRGQAVNWTCKSQNGTAQMQCYAKRNDVVIINPTPTPASPPVSPPISNPTPVPGSGAGVNGQCGFLNGGTATRAMFGGAMLNIMLSRYASFADWAHCSQGQLEMININNWKCIGRDGGTTVTCSYKIDEILLYPACNPLYTHEIKKKNGEVMVPVISTIPCNVGYILEDDIPKETNGKTTWRCRISDEIYTNCGSNPLPEPKVDGVCNPEYSTKYEIKTVETLPEIGLCTSGVQIGPFESATIPGQFSWSCLGTYGGEGVECSAKKNNTTSTARVQTDKIVVNSSIKAISFGNYAYLSFQKNVGGCYIWDSKGNTIGRNLDDPTSSINLATKLSGIWVWPTITTTYYMQCFNRVNIDGKTWLDTDGLKSVTIEGHADPNLENGKCNNEKISYLKTGPVPKIPFDGSHTEKYCISESSSSKEGIGRFLKNSKPDTTYVCLGKNGGANQDCVSLNQPSEGPYAGPAPLDGYCDLDEYSSFACSLGLSEIIKRPKTNADIRLIENYQWKCHGFHGGKTAYCNMIEPSLTPNPSPILNPTPNIIPVFSPTPIQTYIPTPTTIPGAPSNLCGTANNKQYNSNETSFGADTICSSGKSSPSTVDFPEIGKKTEWECSKFGYPFFEKMFGLDVSSCLAERKAQNNPTLVGCGDASGIYPSNAQAFRSQNFCSDRYNLSSEKPVFPTTPGISINWVCRQKTTLSNLFGNKNPVVCSAVKEKTGTDDGGIIKKKCNEICQKDSDCETGKCYQLPMPNCPEGANCLQVMPQKVCRNIKCPVKENCFCSNTDSCVVAGGMCGGFAGKICCSGLSCKASGNHPDASGICERITNEDVPTSR